MGTCAIVLRIKLVVNSINMIVKTKYKFEIIFILLLSAISCNQKESIIEYRALDEIQIIPQPLKLHVDSSLFKIDRNTIIYANKEAKNESNYLKELLESKSEFKVKIKFTEQLSPIEKGHIWLFNNAADENDESYELLVKESAILIYANSDKGIMHGIQSLRQLFVDDFFGSDKKKAWYLPCVQIVDEPTFKHRGMLLDCCRHFFDKEVVKKYIDLLAFYKMNVLHWHLTEDQGWRIEIDKYPKLTEIGAWRIEENGGKYGGFYTKEDIHEIVEYAEQRHITIIPEIELPGHSQAAVAAYPHLSCTGKQVEVANDWGVFKEIYCAGNDSVFTFLEDVLTEVMELFPSEYIHIGGDEAPKYRWENCKKCQDRIKEEGLEDEHELQSYFISRIEKFLNANGKKLIGWDEILEGGLAENATVQSWRGIEGGIEAANSGHDVIMSPTSHCYFDYDLSATDLKKVYSFDPIPADLDSNKHHFIIGGECNLWSERIPDEDNLDSKVFPRMLAMSEVLWSYPSQRDFDEFYNRVQYHYPVLEKMHVKYGEETIPASIEMLLQDGLVEIKPKAGNDHLILKYKWDVKDADFKSFDSTIKLDRSGLFILQAYKNGEKYGEATTQPFEFHNAIGKLVSYLYDYNKWYRAGDENALVDGKTGTLVFRDGNWQGFWGTDVECVVDLGELTTVKSIQSNFYQYNNAWIFLPEKVVFEYSVDGKSFKTLPEIRCQKLPEERGKFIEVFKLEFDKIEARYIRLKATNIKKLPDWHEAAGSDAWLFVDEIIVR